MIDWYAALKTLHILGATVLIGTGSGIAFFMLMAHFTRKPALIAHTAHIVVIADAVFTATAVVLQPISGVALAHAVGLPLTTFWIAASLGLYVIVGCLWLPVVWIQIRLRNIARDAARLGHDLPAESRRLFRLWFACGLPAFPGVVLILWLMVARPVL